MASVCAKSPPFLSLLSTQPLEAARRASAAAASAAARLLLRSADLPYQVNADFARALKDRDAMTMRNEQQQHIAAKHPNHFEKGRRSDASRTALVRAADLPAPIHTDGDTSRSAQFLFQSGVNNKTRTDLEQDD